MLLMRPSTCQFEFKVSWYSGTQTKIDSDLAIANLNGFHIKVFVLYVWVLSIIEIVSWQDQFMKSWLAKCQCSIEGHSSKLTNCQAHHSMVERSSSKRCLHWKKCMNVMNAQAPFDRPFNQFLDWLLVLFAVLLTNATSSHWTPNELKATSIKLHIPVYFNIYRTIPSNLDLNHLMVSTWVTLCPCPILDCERRRLATRSPGRVLIHVSSCYLTKKLSTYMQQ